MRVLYKKRRSKKKHEQDHLTTFPRYLAFCIAVYLKEDSFTKKTKKML